VKLPRALSLRHGSLRKRLLLGTLAWMALAMITDCHRDG